MSRSAASMRGDMPDQRPPASRTSASGCRPPTSAIRRPLSPIASSMKRVITRRDSSWIDARPLEARMERVDLVEQAADERDGGAMLGEREQAGAQAVVDVMRVIGDVVGDRRRLRLEARVEAAGPSGWLPIVAENRGGNAALAVALGAARPRRRAAGRCA